jgi:predicted  nucleic acid-binding Zn-ribbon protein
VNLQKVDSKLDEIGILKGELPMEVSDLEDEIQGLHARQMRVEEEINGITEFIEQKKEAIKEAQALEKKYEKQSENVKNNREFEAINKEIEMQQLEVKLCEKHIKDANEEIAEKAIALEKAKKAIAAGQLFFITIHKLFQNPIPTTINSSLLSASLMAPTVHASRCRPLPGYIAAGRAGGWAVPAKILLPQVL